MQVKEMQVKEKNASKEIAIKEITSNSAILANNLQVST